MVSSSNASSTEVVGGSGPEVMRAEVCDTDGKRHTVTFDPTSKQLDFTITKVKNGQEKAIRMSKGLNEVLAVRATPAILSDGLPIDLNLKANPSDTPKSLFLYVAEEGDKMKWRVRQLEAVFTTADEKNKWLEALSKGINDLEARPKSLLIMVNPFGGKGKAQSVFTSKVKPIMELAGVRCEVMMTEHANHAKEMILQMDVTKLEAYDGVISVGGDGLFDECLWGVVARTQKEAGKNLADMNEGALATPRIKLGIIGAGLANSIVRSVHGTDDCPTAALHVVMGSECKLDVCSTHVDKGLIRLSANAVSFGFMGDSINTADDQRRMGSMRYKWSILNSLWFNNSYFGRVSFTPLGDEEGRTYPACAAGCALCESRTEKDGKYTHHVQMNFSHLIGCVNGCVSPFSPHGLAPCAKIGGGFMDLAIVPKIRRGENIRFMWKIFRHGGKSVLAMKDLVSVYRVTRWSFVPSAMVHPHCEESVKADPGRWNMDGECEWQANDAVYHFKVHPRLIHYYGLDAEHSGSSDTNNGGRSSKKKKVSRIINIKLTE